MSVLTALMYTIGFFGTYFTVGAVAIPGYVVFAVHDLYRVDPELLPRLLASSPVETESTQLLRTPGYLMRSLLYTWIFWPRVLWVLAGALDAAKAEAREHAEIESRRKK